MAAAIPFAWGVGLKLNLGFIYGLVSGFIIMAIVSAITVKNLGDEKEFLRKEVDFLKNTLNRITRVAPLRYLADKNGILIGTCVSSSHLTDRDYVETLIREFSVVTTENELKFEIVHPSPNTYVFEPADRIISLAEANGMRVRGHTLVWHAQLPPWIVNGNFTKEEWKKVLREHILTVVGRYRGRIWAWDVVNEAVDDTGSLRDTVWLKNIGPEYIELAFRWAHEADPGALLFYNDYGIEEVNAKSDAVYRLIKELLKRNVPIHGVGFQMHVSLDNPPNPQKVAENIKRFTDLGLQVHITEMDVRIKLPATEDELIRQAQVYKEILEVCLNSKNCTAFVMWGFTDKYSWIPYAFPGYGAALIFDENYLPKPAYYALWETLFSKAIWTPTGSD